MYVFLACMALIAVHVKSLINKNSVNKVKEALEEDIEWLVKQKGFEKNIFFKGILLLKQIEGKVISFLAQEKAWTIIVDEEDSSSHSTMIEFGGIRDNERKIPKQEWWAKLLYQPEHKS